MKIFAPLGIENVSFRTKATTGRLRLALRESTPAATMGRSLRMDLELPSPPGVDMSGHRLYGTVGDYGIRRMWLSSDVAGWWPVLAESTSRWPCKPPR